MRRNVERAAHDLQAFEAGADAGRIERGTRFGVGARSARHGDESQCQNEQERDRQAGRRPH
jgi:hypothetical protein